MCINVCLLLKKESSSKIRKIGCKTECKSANSYYNSGETEEVKVFFVSIASPGVNLRSNLLTLPFPSNSCTTRRNYDAFTGGPIPKKRKLSTSSTVGVATY